MPRTESTREQKPRSDNVELAIKMLRDGMTPTQVGKRLGQASQSIEKVWLRWIVLPERDLYRKLLGSPEQLDAALAAAVKIEDARVDEAELRRLYRAAVIKNASLLAEIGRLKKTVAELDAECNRLGAELADRMLDKEAPEILRQLDAAESGVPWCEPCRSHHRPPQTAREWREIQCRGPMPGSSASVGLGATTCAQREVS